MRMQVFIVNVDRYKEEQIRGAWFEPPIDFEKMKERIGLDDEYEEYAIFEYDLPFDIEETTPVSEINRICKAIGDIEGSPLYDTLSEVQRQWFGSIEKLIEHMDEIIFYPNSESMIDVAKIFIEESVDIPPRLQEYMDYEAYGHYLEATGNFMMTSRGIFEYEQ